MENRQDNIPAFLWEVISHLQVFGNNILQTTNIDVQDLGFQKDKADNVLNTLMASWGELQDAKQWKV